MSRDSVVLLIQESNEISLPSAEDTKTTPPVYRTRRRVVLYTIIVTILVSLLLYNGQSFDATLSILFVAHLIVLIIFIILFGVLAFTTYRPSEGAFLAIILLDAISLAYYGYVITHYLLGTLIPAFVLIPSVIMAFGCLILPLFGFALLAR